MYMVILLLILSIVTFIIIQVPPGDYLSFLLENMRDSGVLTAVERTKALEEYYGLDLPIYRQYFKWMGNLLQGDMGRSFQYNEPVTQLIGERLALTVSITLVVTYIIAIPIGIYSATHQYSVTDYGFTIFGFMGLATPNFLLALILMFLLFKYLGWSVCVGGALSTSGLPGVLEKLSICSNTFPFPSSSSGHPEPPG